MSSSTTIPSLLATFLERLEGHESLEFEFKSARGGLPKAIWPTVSAFANTNGGWLVLGISEEGSTVKIDGVDNPSAMLKTFHDQVRNPQKVSEPVCGADDASIEELEGRRVIVIRVRAASRKARPVYINGNPYGGTYVRRHSGDYQCTKPEVDRMMRDASDDSADSTILQHFSLDDLDPESLTRYRRRFQTRDPASPWNGYEDKRFLEAIGGYRRDRETGEEGLTVAGLLLLGRPETIRARRTRHLIDFRLLPAEADASERWEDRLAWEGNILGAFEAIYPKLISGIATPFRLQGATRIDESPAHVALREALANLLVHADYSESDASLILRSARGFSFRNPGSSRVPEADLLTGDRSDPRNPVLLRMFRLIGFADEAGTGIPKIVEAWRGLGLQVPRMETGTERYEFRLDLHNTHFLSDEDRAWLLSIGGTWSQAEQLALVHAKHEGYVDNYALRRLTGEHPADTTKVLVGLRNRGYLDMTHSGRGARYELGQAAAVPAIPTAGNWPGGAADAVDMPRGPSDPSMQGTGPGMQGMGPSMQGTGPSIQDMGINARDGEDIDPILWQKLLEIAQPIRNNRRSPTEERDTVILSLCALVPLSSSQLATLLGRHEVHVRAVLKTLIANEELEFLYSDQPRHPKQRYLARRRGVVQSIEVTDESERDSRNPHQMDLLESAEIFRGS